VLKHTTHTDSLLFTLSVNVCLYMHLWAGQLASALFHRMINLNSLDLLGKKYLAIHGIVICIVHLRQACYNSKSVIFQEKLLKVLKCYNFLWVQRWRNCSPAASFANCVMTPYLLKVHLQTFLSIAITQICQILSCDTLVANKRYRDIFLTVISWTPKTDHKHCLKFIIYVCV
jgi:hypothetical protein